MTEFVLGLFLCALIFSERIIGDFQVNIKYIHWDRCIFSKIFKTVVLSSQRD